MSRRIPEGTILELDDVIVHVGPYIEPLNCYRIGVVAGQARGGPAAAAMLEDAWRSTPTDRLRELRKEHGR